MDESKRTLLSSALLGLALAGIFYAFTDHPSEGTATSGAATGASESAPAPGLLSDADQRARRAAQQRVSVRTPEFEAVFTNRNAAMIAYRLLEPRFQNQRGGRATPENLVSTDREELLPLRQTLGGIAIPLDAVYRVEQVDARTARFTWEGDGFRVVRTLRAGAARYTLESETAITNLGRGPRPVRVKEHTYRYVRRSEEGGGMFGRPSPALTQGVCETTDEELLEPRDELVDHRGMGPGVRFAGWGTNYFTSALAPRTGAAERCVVGADDVIVEGEAVGSVFSVELWHARQQVAPNATATFRSIVYAGPKDLGALTAAGHHFEDTVDLGMFGFIARGMVWLLRALFGFVGNWGVAIILLTVIVRALLYPLTASSLESMGKMRVLKPELDRIQQVYGDDQEKKGAAMMALYKQHSINPLAGCLPAVAQMPVWLALYTSLSTNIELYHASFVAWRDLSAPDPYFVLPLALSGLMFVQQKMTPTTMDPMQAKIMLYMMPIMMGAFMLFLPAGLCLYMLTNSTLGIVQQRYVQWRLDRMPAVATTTGSDAVPAVQGTDDSAGARRERNVDERKDKRQDGALFVDEAPFDDEGLDEDEGGARGERRGRAGDGKAEEAQDVLEDLLDHMDLDADVEIREDGERIVLDVEGPDAGRAIGKKGQTLDALQFLVNKIVNRFPGGRRHIIVDAGDYRERHQHGLEQLARREAKRAVTEGKVITLEPMTARDRRVIHLSLAKFEGVSTQSQGEGMGRRIQIIPARVTPGSSARPAGGGAGGEGGNRRRRRRRGGGGGGGGRGPSGGGSSEG